jgi:hypothetical protein
MSYFYFEDLTEKDGLAAGRNVFGDLADLSMGARQAPLARTY